MNKSSTFFINELGKDIRVLNRDEIEKTKKRTYKKYISNRVVFEMIASVDAVFDEMKLSIANYVDEKNQIDIFRKETIEYETLRNLIGLRDYDSIIQHRIANMKFKTDARKDRIKTNFQITNRTNILDAKKKRTYGRLNAYNELFDRDTELIWTGYKKLIKRSIWNTYHCTQHLSALLNSDLRLQHKHHFCNSRICIVCNSIRTAKNYHKFDDILSKISDLYMLTLTVVNCKSEKLISLIAEMNLTFTKIKDSWNRRHSPRVSGFLKLEITYNKKADTYHPHFHLISEGIEFSKYCKKRWLEHFTTAIKYYQDIKIADKDSVLELFKYFTKLYKKKRKKHEVMDSKALCLIFIALRGRRIYRCFGKLYGLKFEEEIQEVVDLKNVIYEGSFKTEFQTWVNKAGIKYIKPSEYSK